MSAAWARREPVEPSRTMSRTGPPCPGCAVSMPPLSAIPARPVAGPANPAARTPPARTPPPTGAGPGPGVLQRLGVPGHLRVRGRLGLRLDAIELLTRIMRREGSDRSAHDVVRRNLARSEDLTLLTDLYDDARERIERSVGPDRRKAIAALEPRANVVDSTQHLRAAGDAIRRAEEQRSRAESRLHEAEREPIRTYLPGRLGEGSRYRADYERRMAEGALFTARRAEQESLRAYEVARHRLMDAETAASEMAVLRGAQDQRESWLREHPDEVQWARDLRERIEERKADVAGLGRDGSRIGGGDRSAARVGRAGRSGSRDRERVGDGKRVEL